MTFYFVRTNSSILPTNKIGTFAGSPSCPKIQQCTTSSDLSFFNGTNFGLAPRARGDAMRTLRSRLFKWKKRTNDGSCKSSIQMAAPYAGQKLLRMPQQIDDWIANHQNEQQVVKLFRERIAQRPSAVWLGDWTPNVYQKAKEIVDRARSSDALFQIVLYNIPLRDAGSYSGGGAKSEKDYIDWIDNAAEGLRGAKGIVILEPDALAQLDLLNQQSERDARLRMMKYAAQKLQSVGVHLYVDIGNPRWLLPAVAADRLRAGGVWSATGFALNVSNSIWTKECGEYGMDISRRLDGKKGYVIDTSRSGAGPPNASGEDQWCNPPSLRLGWTPDTRPSTNFGQNVHALLWVKVCLCTFLRSQETLVASCYQP